MDTSNNLFTLGLDISATQAQMDKQLKQIAKAISARTGITTDVLSRFKNGYVCLCVDDASSLKNYLDKVVLPD